MACWVYVLRGSDGRNYTGITDDLAALPFHMTPQRLFLHIEREAFAFLFTT